MNFIQSENCCAGNIWKLGFLLKNITIMHKKIMVLPRFELNKDMERYGIEIGWLHMSIEFFLLKKA